MIVTDLKSGDKFKDIYGNNVKVDLIQDEDENRIVVKLEREIGASYIQSFNKTNDGNVDLKDYKDFVPMI